MILKIISLILILIGVIFTYDARTLSISLFSFGDQNEATSRTKNTWFHNCNNRSNNVLYLKRKGAKKRTAPKEKVLKKGRHQMRKNY